MRARRGSCAIATLALVAAFVFVFGGSLAAIMFMWVEDRVDLDADTRLPRGGPGDVLLKPVPRLGLAGLGKDFVAEKPHQRGWERTYRSALGADGMLTVRLDASRALVREVVLPRPAPPVTWEGLAARRAWGPPAKTTEDGAVHVSRWAFPIPGGETVTATVRWRGERPGAIDEVRWVR